jgi:exodeoxyribonuclease X
MSHLVRPDRPISPQAMAIHRITESMVADKPWIEEIIPHYYGSPWYVAHNASFDRRVLPEMPGSGLHHEAGASPVAGDQIQQYGAV